MTRALFTACALATLAAIGIGLRVSLRRSPAVQASGDEPPDEPVALCPDEVFAILSVVTCTRCKPIPDGICTCGIDCRHRACMFDHAVLTGLNRDELDFLDGKRGLPL
jgi:hypothetical protein